MFESHIQTGASPGDLGIWVGYIAGWDFGLLPLRKVRVFYEGKKIKKKKKVYLYLKEGQIRLVVIYLKNVLFLGEQIAVPRLPCSCMSPHDWILPKEHGHKCCFVISWLIKTSHGQSFLLFHLQPTGWRQLYYHFVNLMLEMAQSYQPGSLNDEVEKNPFLTSLLPNPELLKTDRREQEEISVTFQIYDF